MTTLRLMSGGRSIEKLVTKQSSHAVAANESVLMDTMSEIENESTDSGTSESVSSKEMKPELGPHVLLDPKIAHKWRPFEMKWCFGFDVNVPIVNLTTTDKAEIMYVSNTNIVIYNYMFHEMRFLQAHQNKICTIAYESKGQYIVTGDRGDDHCMVVWDMLKELPIYTVFDPYPDSGVILAGMSPDGKYVVTVGEATDYVVDLWLWTTGEHEPADSIKIRYSRREPKKIAFNPNKNEHIMVVFETGTVFFTWNQEDKNIENVAYPSLRNKSRLGDLTDGTYVSCCHECYASSNEGYVLKFGSTLYTKDYDETQIDNNKIYINAVKISKGSVTCISSLGSKVIIGDSLGNIQYYDDRVKVLYWQTNMELSSIQCISMNLSRRRFSFSPIGSQNVASKCWNATSTTPKSDNQTSPKKLEEESLSMCWDCFVSTADGNIYAIDTMANKCSPVFYSIDGNVGAIDTHTEMPYVLIAYETGRLILHNYMDFRLVTENVLPKSTKVDEDEEGEVVVTCVKYCSQSYHLVCGRSNGEIWILEPILLTPRADCFHIAFGRITKIAFSADSMQFAYIDSRMTTYLFFYEKNIEQWTYRARLRAHYKEVTDIMFYPGTPTNLITIGADRNIVRYNNCKIRHNLDSFEASRFRIEQTAIPNNMMWYPLFDSSTNSGFILISDNQYKLKLFNDATLLPHTTALGPAYGCYKSNPVRKMILIPQTEGQYMAYMSLRHIGIQILPADGNPYKYAGCAAHHEALRDLALSYDGNFAFTFGTEDRSVIMWTIKTEAVRMMEKLGGTGMEPYYCLLEGGKSGWLFHEMQDLYYYMQVLNMGENTVMPRKVSDTIPVTELPDLVRACGYYPSDFEIEGMMIDIKNRDLLETNTIREEITFLEFVQLYINHRPAYGYSMQELENAFDTYVMSVDDPSYGSITKENFIDSMINTGEAFNEENLFKCLAILLGEDQERMDLSFEFLYDDIDFSALTDDILGIDMDRRELEVEEKSTDPFVREHTE